MQQQERDACHKDRQQSGNQGDQRIVEEGHGQLQAQHRHEMHRPDATAQCHGRHSHHPLALRGLKAGGAARQRQTREPSHECNGERGNYQKRIM